MRYIPTLQLTKNMKNDVYNYLHMFDSDHVLPHCESVAVEASKLATRFGIRSDFAEMAGWLHDISAVVPSIDRVLIAQELEVEVLPQEIQYPPIIHQKLSLQIAQQVFNVVEPEILTAIGCHTTLKVAASALDKVVFIADKIRWDQTGLPPYIDELLSALEESLDHACLVYLRYMWARRDILPVLHPWLRDAYFELSGNP